jgi:hypothetical protein
LIAPSPDTGSAVSSKLRVTMTNASFDAIT